VVVAAMNLWARAKLEAIALFEDCFELWWAGLDPRRALASSSVVVGRVVRRTRKRPAGGAASASVRSEAISRWAAV